MSAIFFSSFGSAKYIMHGKTQIKVIKKTDVKFYKAAATSVKRPANENAACETASTVAGWIDEFRLRTKAAHRSFDCLFVEH